MPRDEDTVRTASLNSARSCGLHESDAVKVATVVSELARNIVQYAKQGSIEVYTFHSPRKGLRIIATDRGPGISDLKTILAGAYKSKTGLGLGLMGSRRMMDEFEVQTAPGRGTKVVAVNYA